MSFFQSAETWVQGVIAAIQNAEQVAEADITAAIAWVNSHIGSVASEVTTVVQGITSVVTSLQAAGVSLPTQTATAIKDANVAVAALNAYASNVTATTSIAGTAQALVDGYVTAKNALAATSTAAAALASNPNGSPVVPVSTPQS